MTGSTSLAPVLLSAFSFTTESHPHQVFSSLNSPCTSIIDCLSFPVKFFFLANHYSFSAFSSNVTGSMKSFWSPCGKMNNTLVWIFKQLFAYTIWPLQNLYQLMSLWWFLSCSIVDSLIAHPLLNSGPNPGNIHMLWNYWITEQDNSWKFILFSCQLIRFYIEILLIPTRLVLTVFKIPFLNQYIMDTTLLSESQNQRWLKHPLCVLSWPVSYRNSPIRARLHRLKLHQGHARQHQQPLAETQNKLDLSLITFQMVSGGNTSEL